MSRYDCRRCDWTPGTDETVAPAKTQLRDHATHTGHNTCSVCATSLPAESSRTCLACVATVRRQLADITDLYALLPAVLVRYPSPQDWRRTGPRSTELPLPGGDALVMLAAGSKARTQGLTGIDVSHEHDEKRGDPPSIAAELGSWEDDWRHLRREAAAPHPAAVHTAVDYLRIRLNWAGDHHPLFDEFARDIARMHRRLTMMIGMCDRPVTGAPCFEDGCGATLERHYGENGLADEWRCPRCRRVYTGEAYWLAVRAQLEKEAS